MSGEEYKDLSESKSTLKLLNYYNFFTILKLSEAFRCK